MCVLPTQAGGTQHNRFFHRQENQLRELGILDLVPEYPLCEQNLFRWNKAAKASLAYSEAWQTAHEPGLVTPPTRQLTSPRTPL